MTVSVAKQVFAHLMQISRMRELRPLEKRTLIRARQILRRQARPAMNPSYRAPQEFHSKAYKGYLIKFNALENMYWIEKDKFFIAWATTIPVAEKMIDELTYENPKAPREQRTGKLVIRDKTDKYWFDKGFNDALLKIRQRSKNQYYIYGYREGKHYQDTREKYGLGSNPANKAVCIYGRCLRIEAIKTKGHTYGGKSTASGQRYFHDFSAKNAKIYGLPNGDLLISTR